MMTSDNDEENGPLNGPFNDSQNEQRTVCQSFMNGYKNRLNRC